MVKAKAKAPAPEKPRAAPKVAFPKKGQPPTHTEFAARLPAPVGKRFEALRAYLKKQGGDRGLLLLRPALRLGVPLHEGRSVALFDPAVRRAAGRHRRARRHRAGGDRVGRTLSDVARRARKLAHGTPALLWLDVPLDGTGATDFKALLKAKLARVG